MRTRMRRDLFLLRRTWRSLQPSRFLAKDALEPFVPGAEGAGAVETKDSHADQGSTDEDKIDAGDEGDVWWLACLV